MSETGQSDEKSEKIEKIYRIIEFEIENANNQLALFKKDNVNFLLLVLALIGFFAFIPIDVFAYNWFGSGIWMMIVCSAMIVILSILLPREIKKVSNKQNDRKHNQKCDSCDSMCLCEQIADLPAKEKIQQIRERIIIENISLIFSAFNYTGFIFLMTAIASYFYLITYDPGRNISSLISSDPVLMMSLMITFLIYIAFQRKVKSLPKDGGLNKYFSRQLLFSGIIFSIGIFFEGYGYFAKVPTFISVSNTSQFSIVLIQHSFSITSFQISLITLLYTIIILTVLLDYFFSSKYVERTNNRLIELLNLKTRVDRYQLGITPGIDIEQIQKRVLNLKTIPPRYFPLIEIISVPIPFDYNRCEDLLHHTLGEMPVDESEKKQ